MHDRHLNIFFTFYDKKCVKYMCTRNFYYSEGQTCVINIFFLRKIIPFIKFRRSLMFLLMKFHTSYFFRVTSAMVICVY